MVHGSRLMVQDPHRVQGDDWFIVNGSGLNTCGFIMEVNTLSIIIYVLVPILTAVLGGWIGAYFGNKYREDKESHEKGPFVALSLEKLILGE